MPDFEFDEPRLAQQIWQLIQSRTTPVVFLRMATAQIYQSRADFCVALLGALLRHDGIESSTVFDESGDWIQCVRHHYQPGDLVVCHSEHTLPETQALVDTRNLPISKFLAPLQIPFTELSGIAHAPSSKLSWREVLRAWMPAIAIIVVSFVFQVALLDWMRDSPHWAQKIALLIAVSAELVSIVLLGG